MKSKFLIPIMLFALLLTLALFQPSSPSPVPPNLDGAPSVTVPADQVALVVKPPVAPLQVAYAQITTDSTDSGGGSGGGLGAFLKTHWLALVLGLFGLLEVIVRLTPSDRDNSIINFLKSLLDAILPNRRSTGGEHA